MGALIAQSSEKVASLLYDFGLALGTAFQIQDDYLDAFGDAASFGKQVGGDIIENKKTYLVIKLQELGTLDQQQGLHQWFGEESAKNPTEKVAKVKELFLKSGAAEATRNAVKAYTQNSQDILSQLEQLHIDTTNLKAFSEALLVRNL
jgi:geranylgeranyl diphosphate synthase type II